MMKPSRHFLCCMSVISLIAARAFHLTTQFSSRPSQRHLNSALNPQDIEKAPSLRSKTSSKKSNQRQKNASNLADLETWRIYGVDVEPDALGPPDARNLVGVNKSVLSPDRSYLTLPVLTSLLTRLRIKSGDPNLLAVLPPQLKDARVVRRSIDARRRKGASPKYSYVIDVTMSREVASRQLKLSHQPGRMERLDGGYASGNATAKEVMDPEKPGIQNTRTKQKIIIVGAGPAGLFCALSLASSGLFTPIVLERGKPVEARGKSIGALIHRRSIDPESNFSFGEGGAGTWSDGKLTTRIGRNSGPVRFVLETLVKYGAPQQILVEGSPHLGTDNLVKLLRNMRADLTSMGGEIHFGARVNKFHIQDKVITGVDAICSPLYELEVSDNIRKHDSRKSFTGIAVVLATGHSARDVYYELNKSGVKLEAKGFAVGFRVEHPQCLINKIQYGTDWGDRAITRRTSTDAANLKYFEKYAGDSARHTGVLPVASYRLATNNANDGSSTRGVYSFCQCPGGQIVPSSTEHGELCINGMSFSKRDSVWANSALVVTVSTDDEILHPYTSKYGSLAGLEFQRDMERKAYELGGGGMRAPVQRLTDFVNRQRSESIPSSSYRLGVTSADCHAIYPRPLYNALVDALVNQFEKAMPGFLCEEALLHGVETRTSSPVRVLRDDCTLQAVDIDNLFPSGEGAGFAGGIVSAAVDGLMVADAVMKKFYPLHRNDLVNIDVDPTTFNY